MNRAVYEFIGMLAVIIGFGITILGNAPYDQKLLNVGFVLVLLGLNLRVIGLSWDKS